EGAHLCLRIERIAEPNRLGKRDEALEELVRDRLMKHEARTRDARLALIVEDSEGRTVDGGGEIRVIEHNVGAFSSELELYFFEVTRRCRNDALPHGRGPGERDLRDLGMFRDVLAGHVAEAGDHVDDTVGDAHLGHHLRDPQRAERGDLRRFDHDAVARGERGSHLPTREHQREIPGHYLTDYAHRLAQQIIEETGIYGDDAAFELVGHAAEIAEAQSRARHVEAARITQWMPRVE